MASKLFQKLSSLVAKVKAAAALTLPMLAVTAFENKQEVKVNIHDNEDWVSLNRMIEEKLMDFMDALEAKIIHTSTNYRSNIQRRMDLFDTENPQESAELQFLKQQGDKLKFDLDTFKNIAVNSGYMAYHQAISSMHTGSSNPKQIVCGVYCEFEKMFRQQYSLNEEYERRLEAKNTTMKPSKDEIRFENQSKPTLGKPKTAAK